MTTAAVISEASRTCTKLRRNTGLVSTAPMLVSCARPAPLIV